MIKVVQELSTSDIFNPQTFKIGKAKSNHVQNPSKMPISSQNAQNWCKNINNKKFQRVLDLIMAKTVGFPFKMPLLVKYLLGTATSFYTTSDNQTLQN